MKLNLDDRQAILEYIQATHNCEMEFSAYVGKSIIFHQDRRYGIGIVDKIRKDTDHTFSVHIKRKLFTENWGHSGDDLNISTRDWWNVTPSNASLYLEDSQLELF